MKESEKEEEGDGEEEEEEELRGRLGFGRAQRIRDGSDLLLLRESFLLDVWVHGEMMMVGGSRRES